MGEERLVHAFAHGLRGECGLGRGERGRRVDGGWDRRMGAGRGERGEQERGESHRPDSRAHARYRACRTVTATARSGRGPRSARDRRGACRRRRRRSPRGSRCPSASKEMSSSSFSITVYRRRAPMFSVRSFTCAGDLGQPADAGVGEFELHALGGEQRLVLACQARVGLGQDALEVVHRQARQLDADRQPALQFRDQVRGLGQVEGAAGDEQDVVGAGSCRIWSRPWCPRPAAAGRAARLGATRRRPAFPRGSRSCRSRR